MKRRIIICISLFFVAVLLSIFTLKVFSLNNFENKSNENNKTRTIKDFIDVETNLIDDRIDIDEDNQTIDRNVFANNTNLDDTNKDIDTNLIDSENNLEKRDSSNYYNINTNEIIDNIEDVPLTDIYPENVINSIQEILNSENTSNYENVKVASQADIEFFNAIKEAADNYVLAYNEASSFIFTGDIPMLEEFVSNEFSDAIETFAEIPTNENLEFEEVKQIYLDGMNLTKKGFEVYIKDTKSEDCNKYFLKADDKFFEGQEELSNVLSEYMVSI